MLAIMKHSSRHVQEGSDEANGIVRVVAPLALLFATVVPQASYKSIAEGVLHTCKASLHFLLLLMLGEDLHSSGSDDAHAALQAVLLVWEFETANARTVKTAYAMSRIAERFALFSLDSWVRWADRAKMMLSLLQAIGTVLLQSKSDRLTNHMFMHEQNMLACANQLDMSIQHMHMCKAMSSCKNIADFARAYDKQTDSHNASLLPDKLLMFCISCTFPAAFDPDCFLLLPAMQVR